MKHVKVTVKYDLPNCYGFTQELKRFISAHRDVELNAARFDQATIACEHII